jgi:WD40 repeat protein
MSGYRSPYLGLASFEERHRDQFFGREVEKADLLRLIRSAPSTVLFGASGLGKTSLLRAGIFPELHELGFVPVYLRIRFRGDDAGAPDASPMAQVRWSLAQTFKAHGAPPPSEAETLWEYFHRPPLWSSASRLRVPVLVFDQFEELFDLSQFTPAVDEFLEQLADIVENRVPRSVRDRLERDEGGLPLGYERQYVHVLISMREDYLAHLQSLLPRIPALSSNRYRLRAMGKEAALEALLEPPRRMGMDILDVDVANRIVAAAAGSTDAVPGRDEPGGGLSVEPVLLSLLAEQLDLQREREGRSRISREAVTAHERSVFQTFYEDSFREVEIHCGRDTCSRLRGLLEERLVTASGSRTLYDEEEAIDRIRRPTAREGITLLVDRHLLRREPWHGRQHLEVIHDRLAAAVLQSRRGRELARVRRRQRKVMASMALLLLVALAVALGFWRLSESRQREAARAGRAEREARDKSDQLARASLTARYTGLISAGAATKRADPVLALLLTRDALSMAIASQGGPGPLDPEPAVTQVHTLLRTAYEYRILRGHKQAVLGATFSPVDPSLFLTRSDDGTAILWRTDGTRLATLAGHDSAVTAARFSRDGGSIATGSLDGTVCVWDLDGKRRVRVPSRGAAVVHVGLSPHGDRIVVIDDEVVARGENYVEKPQPWTDRRIRLLRIDGSEVGSLPWSAGWDAAFGPSGEVMILRKRLDRWELVAWDGSTQARLRFRDDARLAALSPTGESIVTAPDDFHVVVWDDRSARSARLEFRDPLSFVHFTHDGRAVVVHHDGGEITMWGDGTEYVTRTYADAGQSVIDTFGQDTQVRDIRTWNGSFDAYLEGFEDVRTDLLTAHDGSVLSAQFSPDHKLALTTSSDSTARLWLPDAEEAGSVVAPSNLLWRPAVAPDGSRVLLLSYQRGRESLIWHREERKFTRVIACKGEILSAEFDDASTHLLTVGDGDALLWDADARRCAPVGPPELRVREAHFVEAGKGLLLIGEDGTARTWNVRDEKEGLLVHGKADPRLEIHVVVSAEGTQAVEWETVASTGPPAPAAPGAPVPPRQPPVMAQAGARLVRESGVSLPLGGHVDPLFTAAFSPDRRELMTASSDSVRRWDLDGQEIGSITQDHILGAFYSPLGLRVVILDGGNLRILDEHGKPIAVLYMPPRYRLQNEVPGGAREGEPCASPPGRIVGASLSEDGSLFLVPRDKETPALYDYNGRLLGVLPSLAGAACRGPMAMGFVGQGQQAYTLGSGRLDFWYVKPLDVLQAASSRLAGREYSSGEREVFRSILPSGADSPPSPGDR